GAAFNALLKTLEEPPSHAKFIFATTEIRKVPITILSRCQRFDLRRIDASVLVKHLERIAEKEAIEIEPEALALIARAAEGSARVLSRTWQMLFKGITEVAAAGRPLPAAEMVLVRIAYAADLPTPDEALRSLNDSGAPPRAAAVASSNSAGSAPRPVPHAPAH